jgi:sugar phosphate isomerase/epimerase
MPTPRQDNPSIKTRMNIPIERRSFLRAAAGSTLAISGATFACAHTIAHADDASTPWSMKVACSSIAFASLPIEEAVAKTAGLGFNAIDIWSAHAGCPHLDDVLNRLGPNGLKDLLDQHELDLYSFSVYSGGFERYAELLGECGGGVAVRGSSGPVPAEELTTRMKQFLEGLKPLAELAEENDTYLAIENHGNALLDSVDSLKAFADLNTNERLGIALAPYHIQRLDESVVDAIRACGEHLFFIYMWQYEPATAQLPGIGSADMKLWLEALAEIKYNYPITPFMHHEPAPDEMGRAMSVAQTYLADCYKSLFPDAS